MTWLLNKAVLSEGCPLNIIGVCPINYIGGLSNNIIRVCPINYIEGLSNNIIEVCPINYIGELSNKFGYQRMSNEFSKKKNISFILETIFIHGKCMCEGVGEDSRHGAWHVDIHVEMCIFLLEYVWMFEHGTACALRWGVALVGDFLYWALLTPSWENLFKYWRYIRR